MMINAPEVTLFATSPEPLIDATIASLERCREHINFAETIMFAEGHVSRETNFNVIRIDPVGSAQNSGIHYIRNLPKLMKTTHMLVVDWDGWVIHPEMWSDKYLEYDFIGARWPWCPEEVSVGNTGFCLMSKKLLEVLGAMDLSPSGTMDVDIGRTWRPMLEKEHGIKYPAAIVADRFSYERATPEGETLGFHGFFNFWRHIDDSEMITMAPNLPDYVVKQGQYTELMGIYAKLGKFKPLIALHQRLIKFTGGNR